jgi:hypothetical protein
VKTLGKPRVFLCLHFYCYLQDRSALNRFTWLLLTLSLLLVGVTGCAGDARIMSDMFKAAWQGGSSDQTAAQILNPEYRYLRVTLEGRPFLLVLGYVDQDPQTGESIDVWYTGRGEVLKLKNGRLVAVSGTPSDWLAARHKALPTWDAALRMSDSTSLSYERARDQKAGYRFNQQEQVSLSRIAAPRTSWISGRFAGSLATDLVWFEERYTSDTGLPPSFFAVRNTAVASAHGVVGTTQAAVVYSWQCLSVQTCLSLQEWTQEDHAVLQLAQGRQVTQP